MPFLRGCTVHIRLSVVVPASNSLGFLDLVYQHLKLLVLTDSDDSKMDQVVLLGSCGHCRICGVTHVRTIVELQAKGRGVEDQYIRMYVASKAVSKMIGQACPPTPTAHFKTDTIAINYYSIIIIHCACMLRVKKVTSN